MSTVTSDTLKASRHLLAAGIAEAMVGSMAEAFSDIVSPKADIAARSFHQSRYRQSQSRDVPCAVDSGSRHHRPDRRLGQTALPAPIQVGQTLRVNTDNIMDQDGLTNPGWTFQRTAMRKFWSIDFMRAFRVHHL